MLNEVYKADPSITCLTLSMGPIVTLKVAMTQAKMGNILTRHLEDIMACMHSRCNFFIDWYFRQGLWYYQAR
jgi:hypothetical protein